MTKIKNNALLKGLSGKMGETHIYRKVRGKMQMVNLPATGREPSNRQKEFNEKFLKATKYAKAQMADAGAKVQYEEGINDRKHTAYLVAVSDSLVPPQVNQIKAEDYRGVIGDVIKIDATDDFRVLRVRVVILGADGKRLEQGDAIQDVKNLHIWRYACTVPNPSPEGSSILVTAFDMPDNEATGVKVL
jgi:hypothetical protein